MTVPGPAPTAEGVDAPSRAPRLRAGTAWLVDAARDRVTRLAPHGLGVGEEISPHEPPVKDLPDDAGLLRRVDVRLGLSAVGGFAGTLVIAASAPLWKWSTPTWRLTVPGIPHPGSSFVSAFLFVLGLVLLGLAWIGLVGASERLRGSTRRRIAVVAVIAGAWTLPILLGPPLLSNDVYSYTAQGEMASRGIDPTSVGPVALGRGDFLRAVDPTWKTAPAPYGPVWIATSSAVVQVAGHDPTTSVWVFRLVIVAGVVMAAFGVASIARSSGVDRPYALAVGIANPLVILYLIGGYHNDALMMGFLCLGVAAAMKDKRILAVVLLTLATAVKLPAIAALLVVGWVWAGKDAPFRKRILSVAAVMIPAMVALAVLSVATGIGAGWITALRSTGKVMDTFSLMTMLGYFGSDLVNGLGLSDNPEIGVAPVRFLGLLAGLGISYWLMTRAERIGIPRAIGLGMCALVLLGPVMWPWYLPAGFALIAAAGLGRFRPSYMVVVVAVSALVWPTSVNPVEFLTRYQRILSFSVIVLIAVSAWAAQWLAARRHHRRVADRAARGSLDAPGPVDVAAGAEPVAVAP